MKLRYLPVTAACAGLLFSACATSEPFETEGFEAEGEEEEDVSTASSAITTVTTPRGTVANANCDLATSKVSLAIGSGYTGASDTVAPWKNLSVTGTFSLASGANGVQVRYWLDGNPATSQTDAVALGAASGTWGWTSTLDCQPHTLTVCAIPYANGSACGNLDAPQSSGYRVCQSLSFRGCSNAVGVIPDANTDCPAGSDTLRRYMDTEDGGDCSAYGWLGRTFVGHNAEQYFCRVDGTRFKPLTACSTDSTRNYAVLKLGTQCPNGSTEFWRFLDNEDNNNDNNYSISSGDASPNVFGNNTKYHFCLFRSASSVSGTIGTFPDIAAPYGVFAPAALVTAGEASTSGHFWSNDENSGNSNSYGTAEGAPPDTAVYAQQIITPGSDTRFYMAKAITSVSPGTGLGCPPPPTIYCGDGLCNGTETSASCAEDCWVAPPPCGSCFAAGTGVTMADGSTRPIEQISAGDHVLAFDLTAGRAEAAPVTDTFVHPAVSDIVLVNGRLTTTTNHPFFANGRWVRADELRVGDELLRLDGRPSRDGYEGFVSEPVTSVESLAAVITTYNLEVDRHHDYFAGGVLVHNKPVCEEQ